MRNGLMDWPGWELPCAAFFPIVTGIIDPASPTINPTRARQDTLRDRRGRGHRQLLAMQRNRCFSTSLDW